MVLQVRDLCLPMLAYLPISQSSISLSVRVCVYHIASLGRAAIRVAISKTSEGEKATQAQRLQLACNVCEHVWGDGAFAQAARALIAATSTGTGTGTGKHG